MVQKINVDVKGYLEYLQNRDIFIYGAGLQGERMAWMLSDMGFSEHVRALVDNNPQKQNTFVFCDLIKYSVISLENAYQLANNSAVFVITSLHYENMYASLVDKFVDKNIDCIIAPEVSHNELQKSSYVEVIKESEQMLIPPIIHYVWVGNEMPDNIKRNVDKWHQLCPDFEIKRWDDTNYNISQNRYMKQAYDRKMWGFVPDYMRLDIIYQYGGIYLDTDIELVKNPSELLYQKCFGCVDASLAMNFGSGFGSVPGHQLIKECRDYYDSILFEDSNGNIDKTSCNTHTYKVLRNYGVKISSDVQCVAGMNIYPIVFQGAAQYTQSIKVTNQTYWIHHGMMSWY